MLIQTWYTPIVDSSSCESSMLCAQKTGLYRRFLLHLCIFAAYKIICCHYQIWQNKLSIPSWISGKHLILKFVCWQSAKFTPREDILTRDHSNKYNVIMVLTLLGPPTHLVDDLQYCTVFRKAYILSGSDFHEFLYSII